MCADGRTQSIESELIMITTRRYGMVVAAVSTAALIAGPLEPAAAADVEPDRVDAKTPLADYVPRCMSSRSPARTGTATRRRSATGPSWGSR